MRNWRSITGGLQKRERDFMSAITTYTGTMVDPLNPKPDQIDSRDIAHALSMLCRANGHFKTFYSVGQHCVNCMQEAAARGYSRKVQLACLLHDASEAYLSDVTRPVKHELPQYLEIEMPLQEAIWNKYLPEPMTPEERKQVQDIDDAMLYHEFLALMDTRLAAVEPVLQAKPEFDFVGFSYWETRYLQSLSLLTKAPASMGGEKEARYQALVEKARLSYASYDGPPDGKNPRLSWCNVCQEINLWTYWQGRGNLNAPILLVGQDWGCLRTKDGEACIRKIQLAPDGPIPNYMAGNDNPTDKNLVQLFQEALSIPIERSNSNVFFTNFVLGYRNEGTSGGFKPDWIRHDQAFFRELAEIIEPQVILCLGRNTFEGVLTAFSKQVQIGAYNHFIESDQNPVPVMLNSGKTAYIFALAHCGVMGTLNRNQGKDTSLNTQIQDWKRIRPYLEGVIHADSIT